MDSYAAVVDYLLAQGLLEPSVVIETGFVVSDASRRNRNLRIEFGGGGYFAKIAMDIPRRLTVAHEARTYTFLRRVLGEAAGSSLARVHHFDPDCSILVLELLGSDTVETFYSRKPGAASTLIRKLGSALGKIHRDLLESMGTPEGCPAFEPVPFELWRPSNTFLETCSSATLEFVRMLQRSERLCLSLASLKSWWLRSMVATPVLIHSDVRLENCCLARDGKSLRIVDWELAGIGDPAWDTGSVFGDLLSRWLLSIPPSGSADPGEFVHLAATPIESLKHAAQTFWNSYVRARGLAVQDSLEALQTSVRYAAARLIQLALENLRGANHITLNAVAHLQMSDNLLARPVDGGALLLGLVA